MESCPTAALKRRCPAPSARGLSRRPDLNRGPLHYEKSAGGLRLFQADSICRRIVRSRHHRSRPGRSCFSLPQLLGNHDPAVSLLHLIAALGAPLSRLDLLDVDLPGDRRVLVAELPGDYIGGIEAANGVPRWRPSRCWPKLSASRWASYSRGPNRPSPTRDPDYSVVTTGRSLYRAPYKGYLRTCGV
jgi:hypothetical protein